MAEVDAGVRASGSAGGAAAEKSAGVRSSGATSSAGVDRNAGARLNNPFASAPTVIDDVPPTVDNENPLSGAVIDPATNAVSFDVKDTSSSFASILITVSYTGTNFTEVIFDGSNFSLPFATLSTQTPITEGFSFSLQRQPGGGESPGWLQDMVIRVFAVDAAGNTSVPYPVNFPYTVPNGPGIPGGGPPGTGPVVQNVQPNTLSEINENQTITFELVDADNDIFDVVIFAIFENSGIYEVVYDGDAFTPRYLQGSSRQTITNGFKYTIKRVGPWMEMPLIRIRAFDTKLNPAG